MQKHELTQIVDAVCSNWNIHSDDKVSLYRTWWRYLSDLSYEDTLKIIDGFVVSGMRFPPRVGDVRRRVVDLTSEAPPLPSDDVAWAHAHSRWDAVALGMEPPLTGQTEIDNAISAAMRQASRPEKYAFTEAWETVRSEIESERYGLPDNAPELSK